ncbi:MAG: hypothetical protein JWP06_278 [Candidatus Saccharibacteria bacterium]|nr:hypothetical protein [Candidatus Saccharibacteria bacterium]
MSPSGKALVFGTSIRGFESLHPSHEIINHIKHVPFGRVLYGLTQETFSPRNEINPRLRSS